MAALLQAGRFSSPLIGKQWSIATLKPLIHATGTQAQFLMRSVTPNVIPAFPLNGTLTPLTMHANITEQRLSGTITHVSGITGKMTSNSMTADITELNLIGNITEGDS
jgi:hypothetical protein